MLCCRGLDVLELIEVFIDKVLLVVSAPWFGRHFLVTVPPLLLLPRAQVRLLQGEVRGRLLQAEAALGEALLAARTVPAAVPDAEEALEAAEEAKDLKKKRALGKAS